MVKVACPTTIVQKLKSTSASPIAERSAIPVTMPGIEIGSKIKSEIDSLPKKRVRANAKDANVPMMIAERVANPAVRSDKLNASQKSSRWSVTAIHLVVKPGGGKRNEASSVVKAYKKMIQIGICRNKITAPAESFSPQEARESSCLKRIESS